MTFGLRWLVPRLPAFRAAQPDRDVVFTAKPSYWRLWLEAAGASGIDPDHGMTFESVSLAYQMALDGAGVALGQLVLVADDLQAGRLVAPFAQRTDSTDAFYLIYPNRLTSDPFVMIFRDWLLGEASDGAAAEVA